MNASAPLKVSASATDEFPECGGTQRRKPRVLVCAGFFLPGFRGGGPIRTLANLIDCLGDEFDFFVVTQDRDLGDASPYASVDLSRWNTVERAQVRYLARSAITLNALRSIVAEVTPDIIYLNSFFDVVFTQQMLLLRRLGKLPDVPTIVAPRGEFSAGALAIKPAKKRAFLILSRALQLRSGLCWQASSVFEKDDIVRTLGEVDPDQVTVAVNIGSHEAGDIGLGANFRYRTSQEVLRVCTLSRISPMKNLHHSIRCLQKVKAPVVFTIYGPKEDLNYWAESERLIAALPGHITVIYAGEVNHSQVRSALSEHDLFLLPTRGENYGHVILEALSVGLPVLISDRTPWQDLNERGAGWTVPLAQIDTYTQVIDAMAAKSPQEAESMRQSALTYWRDKSLDRAVADANRQLFMQQVSDLKQ